MHDPVPGRYLTLQEQGYRAENYYVIGSLLHPPGSGRSTVEGGWGDLMQANPVTVPSCR
jgi:hypothetical protein